MLGSHPRSDYIVFIPTSMKTLADAEYRFFVAVLSAGQTLNLLHVFSLFTLLNLLLFLFINFFACSNHILGRCSRCSSPLLRFPDLKNKVVIYFFSNLLAFWGRKEEADRHCRKTL